ncbi:hypothetical protein J2800_004108 [Caulobacter rhizosphaerae]|uniref:Uncharacterized protein n=1 Tax=Caulobacter rhizosphaerae TaxID=2010972 RepID=A0ABU1N4G2_9CAUL|nr:hypothetical protein [Caulobacter rhizosphaerae]MDR6533346.1 hypothetical protein [Caulobacter rhizosphaerae]
MSALTDSGERGRRTASAFGPGAAWAEGSDLTVETEDANTGLDRPFGARSGRRHVSEGRSRSAARVGTAASRRDDGSVGAGSRETGARAIVSTGGGAAWGWAGGHVAGSLFRDNGTSPASASRDVRSATCASQWAGAPGYRSARASMTGFGAGAERSSAACSRA